MLFTWEYSIPASTTKANAKELILPVAKGIINSVSVTYPPGAQRLAHTVILHAEQQIFPSTENMDLAGDTFPIAWTDYYEVYHEPYSLKALMWNEDTINAHEVSIAIAILPRKAILALAIVDAISNIWDLLNPKRIFTSSEEE